MRAKTRMTSLRSIQAFENDYLKLIAIWEKSVKETHQFLAIADFEAIKKELPTYFSNVDLKIWLDQSDIIGFSGVFEQTLEMLFLDPSFIGKGYGRQILACLVEKNGVQLVDVNEQNQAALKFYQTCGFEEYDRSELDDADRPYPIINLKRSIN